MNLPNVQSSFLPFNGGYDTETPPWSVPPGMVKDAQNYEIAIQGGYQDIQGYERFDGRPSPSDATYYILNVTFSGVISVGDTVTQTTSGATGYVLAVSVSSSPAYIVLTKVTGTFDATNTLTVGAVVQATSISTALADAAPTAALHATYQNLAADEYRDDIGQPTGSGGILGVWNLSGTWYCARNNAGATAAGIWKESSSGWTSVSLGRQLSFTSGGTYEIAEGNTITGATSGATAVITRVVLTSGSWAGGDAAGKLIFASDTGTFQAENLNVGANLNVATIAGDSSAITLSPSGRFETVNYNFGSALRTYGVDGVNKGFEFDGTVFVPIDTGMTTDTPTHVAAHKNHLFFSFGASVQHSGIGDPYSWSPITGAAELNVGETCTGFMSEPGASTTGALGIYGRNRIHMLYGTSSSDWELIQYREEVGAYAYTLQQIGATLFVDDMGIANLRTAQEFGNFQHGSMTTHIQRWINDRAALAVASCVARKKSQYRVFFSDASALYVTMEGASMRGAMPIAFDHTPTCATSIETSTGVEEIMVGCSNGYVYQLDKGTSFDGAAIEGYLTLHYDFCKSTRLIKKWLHAILEARGTGYAEFQFTYDLAYSDALKSQPSATTATLPFATRVWDSGSWDSGSWDGVSLTPGRHKVAGSSENISLTIRKNSDSYQPITFSGALLRYIPRRFMR